MFVYIEKANQKDSKNNADKIQTATDKLINQSRGEFINSIHRLKNTLRTSQLMDAIEKKRAFEKVDDLILWEKIDDQVDEDFQNVSRIAINNAGVSTMDFIKKDESIPTRGVITSFDTSNPRVDKWILNNTAKRIVEVQQESKDAVRNIIRESIKLGRPPAQAASLIKGVVGLTTRQSQAVSNFLGGLINSGEDFLRADKLAGEYAERLLNHRSFVIARNEILNAMNAGTLEGWTQAVEREIVDKDEYERMWITALDERTCPICAPMNRERAPIDGYWTLKVTLGVAPSKVRVPTESHIQCRCTQILVKKKKKG